jgi:hypothetical protein
VQIGDIILQVDGTDVIPTRDIRDLLVNDNSEVGSCGAAFGWSLPQSERASEKERMLDFGLRQQSRRSTELNPKR